jgi:hypothetical protein
MKTMLHSNLFKPLSLVRAERDLLALVLEVGK